MTIYGVDLGSRYVKLAVEMKGTYVRLEQFDTIAFYREYGRRAETRLAVDLSRLGVGPGDGVVATGYGRHNVGFPGFQPLAGGETPKVQVIPELSAHMAGAMRQTGRRDFTLLDIGGQDTKVVRVRGGVMDDFATNDRCAASSGRYLENTASALGVGLGELSKHVEDPADLNSTCAIFAESELIGKVIEGYELPSLCAGVNWSMWRRLRPHLERLRSDVVVFVGGVARSEALKTILSRELGVKVIVPERPDFNGAIGCCARAGLTVASGRM